MEQQGLVVSNWHFETGPARRYYKLTEQGEAVLKSWMQALKFRKRALDNIISLFEENPKEEK